MITRLAESFVRTGYRWLVVGIIANVHNTWSIFSFVYFSSACTYTPQADQVSWFRSGGTHTNIHTYSGDRDGEERQRQRVRRQWENYWPTKASRDARVCMAITAAGASIALTQRHSTTREPARAGREVTTDRASTLCTHTHIHTYIHIHTRANIRSHTQCWRYIRYIEFSHGAAHPSRRREAWYTCATAAIQVYMVGDIMSLANY
jgi:hypothetical protein